MKLIVGLGNPGKAYQDSRHNIGFSVVRTLAKAYNVSFNKDSGTFSLSAEVSIDNQSLLLAVPFTFMNLSGVAVRSLLKKRKIDLKDLLVVYDDLDLEFGRLRIQPSGSSGGHRGLKSIIDYLESEEFVRLRIGIGRPPENIDPAKYVLDVFTPEEKDRLQGIIAKACECCRVWWTEGITTSTDIFNQEG